MSKFARRVLSVLLIAGVALYGTIQLYRHFNSPIKTTDAIYTDVYDEYEVDSLVMRNEIVINSNLQGTYSYQLLDGEMIDKNGVVAKVYNTKQEADAVAETNAINKEINNINSLNAFGTSLVFQPDVVDKQIKEQLLDLLTRYENLEYDSFDDKQSSVVSLMNKKQLLVKKEQNFDQRINELNEKKKALSSSVKDGTNIISENSGYFVSTIDGYEKELTAEKAKQITVAELKNDINNTHTPDMTNVVGKVVNGYEWYIGAVVGRDQIDNFKVGGSYVATFPYVSKDDLNIEVVAINPGDNGENAVIFRCTNMNSQLASIRNEKMVIKLNRFIGLKIDKDALRFNEDNEQGVYVKIGSQVRFKKINLLHSTGNYAICEYNPEDQNGLSLYDEVIVRGKELYDGKIIK